MMETENIPFGLLVFFGLFFAFIFLVFWCLHRYVLPFIKNRPSRRFISTWFLRLEILIWVLFAIYVISLLTLINTTVALIFITLMITLGWNSWKNLISGLLFRLERKIEVGEFMYLDKGEENAYEGTVQKIRSRSITIRQVNGDFILIPYSRLDSAIISKSNLGGILMRHTFDIELKGMDLSKVKDTLMRILHECPWSVPAKDPIIKNLGGMRYQITSFTFDKNAGDKLASFVRKRIADFLVINK